MTDYNTKKPYEFLEHPSELKIRSFGRDLPELFSNSALAMMEYLYGAQYVTGKISEETITVNGNDLEILLVNWLSEILCLTDTNKLRYLDYEFVEFSANKIIAQAKTIPAQPINDIKAVTFHELKIKEITNKYWQAEVVYDI